MDDVSCLHKKLKEKFVRLQNYELMAAGEKYADYYYSIMFEMVKHLSGLIMQETES